MAHGDYTGRQKAQLAIQYQDQQARKAREMALVTQVAQDVSSEPVDLMPEGAGTELQRVDPADPESEIVVVDVNDPLQEPVTFRSRETLEGVTVGKDNHYNFNEGQQYIVPRWVYQHLDEQGVVYH